MPLFAPGRRGPPPRMAARRRRVARAGRAASTRRPTSSRRSGRTPARRRRRGPPVAPAALTSASTADAEDRPCLRGPHRGPGRSTVLGTGRRPASRCSPGDGRLDRRRRPVTGRGPLRPSPRRAGARRRRRRRRRIVRLGSAPHRPLAIVGLARRGAGAGRRCASGGCVGSAGHPRATGRRRQLVRGARDAAPPPAGHESPAAPALGGARPTLGPSSLPIAVGDARRVVLFRRAPVAVRLPPGGRGAELPHHGRPWRCSARSLLSVVAARDRRAALVLVAAVSLAARAAWRPAAAPGTLPGRLRLGGAVVAAASDSLAAGAARAARRLRPRRATHAARADTDSSAVASDRSRSDPQTNRCAPRSSGGRAAGAGAGEGADLQLGVLRLGRCAPWT